MTDRLLSQLLHGDEARHVREQIKDVLGPFLDTWRPSTLAHNDFYDDQLLVTPDGHLVLVDFELFAGKGIDDVGKEDLALIAESFRFHARWNREDGRDSEN